MDSMDPQPPPSRIRVQWAGETVILLPSHAVLWPADGVLFVADLHLGKAASYRALGQPVPGGSTQDNLLRLDQLIADHAPRQLVFLGDFLHAVAGRTPALIDRLSRWRAQHDALKMTLVRGNHDLRAGDPPRSAGIDTVGEPWLLGPFACCHHPCRHPTHFVLAGHEHPVVRLSGPARDHMRVPCFVSDERQAILPAFGVFTGGHPVSPASGRVLHAVAAGRVWRVPRAAPLARR